MPNNLKTPESSFGQNKKNKKNKQKKHNPFWEQQIFLKTIIRD